MGGVEEFERRIAAALARIGEGLARAQVPPAGGGDTAGGDGAAEVAALRAALDEERTANAQLEERLRGLRDRHEAREAALIADRDAARAQLADLDAALQSLRQSQAELSETVAQLRGALAAEVAEPDLVNRAMQAEIDGLRALRGADAAEVDAVIAELRPLIEAAPDPAPATQAPATQASATQEGR